MNYICNYFANIVPLQYIIHASITDGMRPGRTHPAQFLKIKPINALTCKTTQQHHPHIGN